MINQALLANRRAIARLFVNLMEADLKKELSLRFKWQDRVKAWKIMQKDYVVHSFRCEVVQQIMFWSLNEIKLTDVVCASITDDL